MPAELVPLSSLPDSVGQSHAKISWPAVPGAAAYVVYGSDEITMRANYGMGEPNLNDTLSDRLTELLDAWVADPDRRTFTRLTSKPVTGTSVDLALPRGTTGISTFVVLSMSAGEVEGNWPVLGATGLRDAVIVRATPRIAAPSTPEIEARVDGSTVHLIMRTRPGHRVGEVQVYRVRVDEAARELDTMGPPVATVAEGAPGWTVETDADGTPLVFTGTDTPGTSWRRVWYRAVAWADPEYPVAGEPFPYKIAERGLLSGRSEPSNSVSVTVPPPNPPNLSPIAITWPGGNVADVQLDWTTTAPFTAPLGVHRTEVDIRVSGTTTSLVTYAGPLGDVADAAPSAGDGLWRDDGSAPAAFHAVIRRPDEQTELDAVVRVIDPLGRATQHTIHVGAGIRDTAARPQQPRRIQDHRTRHHPHLRQQSRRSSWSVASPTCCGSRRPPPAPDGHRSRRSRSRRSSPGRFLRSVRAGSPGSGPAQGGRAMRSTWGPTTLVRSTPTGPTAARRPCLPDPTRGAHREPVRHSARHQPTPQRRPSRDSPDARGRFDPLIRGAGRRCRNRVQAVAAVARRTDRDRRDWGAPLMTVLPPAITPATATQRLQDDGLAALGLTMPLLSPTWSSAAVTFNEPQLTLTMTAQVQAPMLAIRSWVTDLAPHGLYGIDGLPLAGPGAIVRLHPQAALRLDRLMRARLGAAAGDIRPVPTTMAIRNVSDTLAPQWFNPGTMVAPTGLVTFHDDRGLILDPVAVAGLFADLLTELPGLGAAPSAAPGGVGTIAAMGPAGVFVHVVDPHGGVFQSVDSIAPRIMSGATDVGPIPSSGVAAVAGGQSLGIPAAAADRLRLGWSRNFTMGRDALVPPALPAGVTLHRQFLRATAVDLRWHLLGNRSATSQHSVGPDDQSVPAEFKPAVRDRVRMDLSVDGVATLGAAAEVLAPPNNPPFSGFMFAASPTLDTAVGVPPGPGAAGHWPNFPDPPPGMPGPAPTGAPDSGLSAVWSGPHDVVLTFAAGTLPLGSHVRVYPQVFKLITAITADQPSFVRGDGAAGIVADVATDLSLLLTNPLDLPAAANQPADSTLTLDLVLVDRAGDLTIKGAVSVPVTTGTPPTPADAFATPDVLAIVPDNVRSLAPSPVFGVPSPVTPPGSAPTSLVDLLRALASESTPRIGPRLPTMARFPTLLAVATDDGSTPTWDALVTGGRWSRETRSADPAAANPGGPAGPDVHAPGVRVDGQAAFDVAQIALRRVQPLLPLGAGGLGWIPFVGDEGWEPPAEPGDDTAPAGQTAARTSAVAVLRTVAIGAESPELTLPVLSIPAADASVQNLVEHAGEPTGDHPADGQHRPRSGDGP